MNKAIPYFYTWGTEKFGEFLRTPFNMNMLCYIDDNSVPTLFLGWTARKIGVEKISFTSKKTILTFNSNNFLEITTFDDKSYVNIKTPFTIGEFITLLHMLNIHLYWSDWIEENFEPKDFLPRTRIEDYYADLLHIMDKDHELLTETEKKRGYQ